MNSSNLFLITTNRTLTYSPAKHADLDEHTDSQLSKVRHLGLCKRIQSLTISDEVGVRKPNIKMFHVACERAEVSPKDSMCVGDSIQNDIVGANSVGMTSIHINRKSDLLIPKMGNEHPDYSISNLYDILSYLWKQSGTGFHAKVLWTNSEASCSKVILCFSRKKDAVRRSLSAMSTRVSLPVSVYQSRRKGSFSTALSSI